MKIAILDDYGFLMKSSKHWQRLENFHLDFYDNSIDILQMQEYDILVGIRERTIFDKGLLQKLPNLKHLCLTGRVSSQADLSYLQKKNIATSYTSGASHSTAELAIGFLLEISKKIATRNNALRKKGWSNDFVEELHGKTIGILGLGKLGTRMAKFAQLLEMKVLSWGINNESKTAQELGIARISLPEIFQESDFVSLHLRLSEKTKGILNYKILSQAKQGLWVINTARAGLFVEQDLHKALKQNKICLATDVYHNEPLTSTDPIWNHTHCILSPHLGYVNRRTFDIFCKEVVENILHWQAGEEYKNAHNS